jgi:hypothetical protein
MSHPNDKASPLEMESLRQGIDFRFPVDFKGKKIKLRPLSIMEEDQIARDILGLMNDLPAHERNSMSETIRLTQMKLEIASTSDVGVYDPSLPQAELKRLTPPQIDKIFKEWLAGCEKANPAPEKVTAEQLEIFVEALKKSTENTGKVLTELSFFQLVDICQFLVNREKSPTDKSLG